MPRLIDRIVQQDRVNFLITNGLPRMAVTRFMGWFSQIEQPIVRDLSMRVWTLFAGDLNLHEARRDRFRSLHDCFIRELKEGARPIHGGDDVIVSPCDGLVGASGAVEDGLVLQAKGSRYPIAELLTDPCLVERYRDGRYVTLRLTSTMYHRFHAPAACTVEGVTYVPGDVFNVNPPALRYVERLYCRNERAIVHTSLAHSSEAVMLVPVAAILVGSIQFHFLDQVLNGRYAGPRRIPCRASFRKGEEMGYFRHGSTIIVFATSGLERCPEVVEGRRIRMGEPLFTRQRSR